MNKIREIIYFYQNGVTGIRRIARACNKSRTAVSHVLSRMAALNLTASHIESISDADLENIIYPVRQKPPDNFIALEKNLPALLNQLHKKHNTIFNVWEDYRKENPDGYSYSRFCFNLRQLQNDDEKISMHLEHAPGDKLFVDFAGDKLDVMHALTDEKWLVNIFLAVLPNSLYTYVEATENETTASWITASENAQIFFGGVPQAIIPDCATAVVKKADRYESAINPQYKCFARHYKTVILPARPGHPQDKALVESTVRLVYQRIYARLAGQRFSSIQEINAAIRPLLEEHNNRNMRAWNCSRRELFESREKALLKDLPQNRFDYFEYEPPRSVAWNCHVYFKPDRHYYSVPMRFKSQKCAVFYTNLQVEVYFGSECIAIHKRDRKQNGYTTNPDHIPPAHKAFLEWTPERLVNWGATLGKNTGCFIEHLFANAEHPFQAMRSAMGVISLSKKYNQVRIENACARAISFDTYSYKKLESILLRNADFSPEEQLTFSELPEHKNLRFLNQSTGGTL